jgi:hypothetical protein
MGTRNENVCLYIHNCARTSHAEKCTFLLGLQLLFIATFFHTLPSDSTTTTTTAHHSHESMTTNDSSTTTTTANTQLEVATSLPVTTATNDRTTTY